VIVSAPVLSRDADHVSTQHRRSTDGAEASASRPLRVLVFSSLFPSEVRPRHGIFVETRLAQLTKDYPIDARVIAPVPWFPSSSRRFGVYAAFAATPRRATRPNGVPVTYPRYAMLPKVGTALQPGSMARAALADVLALQCAGWQPDLIDAHYLYPDSVAAAIIAERLNLPLVITARGTDVNLLARLPGPGRRILRAAQRASAVIAVSSRLKQALLDLGMAASKLVVLRNGVDTEMFRPTDRHAARVRFGFDSQPIALCVGNLVQEKGFELAIDALVQMHDWQLLIVGDGPARAQLAEHALRAGVARRVRFHPNMPQHELADAYSAADVLLLTSTREGWPNVVLESLACGTPVVAVDVGAVDEMITDPAIGRVIADRDAVRLAGAVNDLMRSRPDRDRTREHACQFDWPTISRGQWDIFTRVRDQHSVGAR
jgi:teichuronic acid biosynthesis glycosyltransferase TuaC